MKVIGIIPARYDSSRFPGKPLAKIIDKPMIQWVYESCLKSELLADVVVATDNQEIFDCVLNFGGKAIFTNNNQETGTSRCIEAFDKIGQNFDAFINIQGDEPFIDKQHLEKIISILQHPSTEIATLCIAENNLENFHNPNVVKLVKTIEGKALYFSRASVPHYKTAYNGHLKHIGLYAFKASVISKLKGLNYSQLERSENLEQLNWLENGLQIFVECVDNQTIGVDTPEDLIKAAAFALKLRS